MKAGVERGELEVLRSAVGWAMVSMLLSTRSPLPRERTSPSIVPCSHSPRDFAAPSRPAQTDRYFLRRPSPHLAGRSAEPDQPGGRRPFALGCVAATGWHSRLNSDRYLELMYALPWMGAVMVPVNTRLAAPEIEYILNDSGAAALFVDTGMSTI